MQSGILAGPVNEKGSNKEMSIRNALTYPPRKNKHELSTYTKIFKINLLCIDVLSGSLRLLYFFILQRFSVIHTVNAHTHQ